MRKLLPIGIENFAEITKSDFYYVDKTSFIQDLICARAKVNLITRPRCFGKSLTLSMLKNFFEIGSESVTFDGLYIKKHG